MIVIEQKIERTGTGFSPKEWREILKDGWELVGKYWHRVLLKKHFTFDGAREYGYQKRTKKYMKRKARVHGHQRPLEFSGNLKNMAHRTRDLRPTSKGVNIVIHGPPIYFTQYRTQLKQPHLAKEIGEISEKDAALCARVLDKHIDRAMKKRGKIVNITSGHRA